MNIKNGQESVANWMRTYGQETPEKPTIPSLEVRKLRAKLILEEALETIVDGLGVNWVFNQDTGIDLIDLQVWLKDANFHDYSGPNLTELADGLADLAVVTLGTNVACGIPAQECFDEVMRSNGSKMWTDFEVNIDNALTDIIGTPIGHKLETHGGMTATRVSASSYEFDRCWLVKDASGKVKKSPSYSPADFYKIL